MFVFLSLDPFSLKRNVARSLNSQMVFEYIQERFRSAYKYFACPQKRGAARRQGNKKVEADRREEESVSAQSGSDDEDGAESKRDEQTVDARLRNMLLSKESKASSPPNGLLDSDEEEEEEENRVPETDESFTADDLHYLFDRMIFTGGKVTATTLKSVHFIVNMKV